MDAPVPAVIEEMHAEGKGVYGMKVCGAGQLTDDISKSLEFAESSIASRQ